MSEDKSLSDILKKVVSTGVSAAFMKEEAVKNVLADLPLPKEIVNNLVQTAKNSKDDFIESVKSELNNYLNDIDITNEIDKIAEKYDIEINAKVKLTPKKKTSKSK